MFLFRLQDPNQLGNIAAPSPGSRATFAAPAMKVVPRGVAPPTGLQNVPRLPTNQPGAVPRPMIVNQVNRPGFAQPPSPFSPQAPQSPHDFPQSPAASQPSEHFQRFENSEAFAQGGQAPRTPAPYTTSPRSDVYSQPPGTPRPMFNAPTPRPTTHVYAPPRTPDPYSSQPATPSPVQSFPSPRPDGQPGEIFNQQPEVNRQLRDLLQRQQFSKKIEPIAGAWNQGTLFGFLNFDGLTFKTG